MTSVQAELSSTRLGAEPDTLSHALDALEHGWSVTPLRGGKHPVSGKQPRGAWQQFQKQQATEQQLQCWFANGGSAYGVICGAVSNLIVIDFDDAAVQAEFIKRFPHLLNTRIVQSGLRGTLHIYLKADFPVKTCKLRGGDLKAEGSYVVGAGSQIAGGVWTVIKDCPLYTISQDELDMVIAAFGLAQLPSFDLANMQERMRTPDACIRTYQLLIDQFGSRNEALFCTGCSMRDAGYGLADVITLLATVHVEQQPVGQHQRENYQQHYAEAERTLRSVFSRPPRLCSRNDVPRQAANYVANSLREHILMYPAGVSFLRVYAGLRLVGKSVGDTVSEGEVVALLSPYGIGRPTVRQALQFAVTPAPRPSPHAVAEIAIQDSSPKTCVFVPTTKGDKKRGRPARHYLIPDVEQLYQIFNVEPKGSDGITLPDIRTAQSYRAALNRELIQRRPGQYSQKWLGKRLNVSERTIQRYVNRENIQSQQLLEATSIEWGNVNQIPTRYTAKRAGFDIQRYFLQDEQVRRYPPKPEIAKKLLRQHHQVWLMKRGCNLYWCDTEPPLPIVVRQPVQSTSSGYACVPIDDSVVAMMITPTRAMRIRADGSISDMLLSSQGSINPRTPKQPDKQPKRSERHYKQPLPDDTDEWLAQKVYQATGNLQEIEARQLVDKYGRKAVGQTLGRMEYLRERGHLRNPAGFMKVVARVAWRTINGFDTPLPEYKAPKKRKGRKATHNPKQDPIWQSEAYRTWRLSFAEAPIDIWEMPTLATVIDL